MPKEIPLMTTTIKKAFITFAVIFLSIIAYGQKGKRVFLQWKLQPKEVLSYKTTMEEIDTANFKDFSIDYKGFFGVLDKLVDDSTLSKEIEAKKFLTQLNKYLNSTLVTYLTEDKKGIIDISVNYKQTDTASAKDTIKNSDDFNKMVEMMMKNVQLRGAINDSGSIQSFYVKNDQRNLIALFFQLPGKPVRIGDNWSLDVHFISMDQNFKCDTSYHKNLATLVGLKKANGETIAVLKYDIVEYVSGDYMSPFEGSNKKTKMKMTCSVLAEFSVDRGRWVSYDGIMSLVANGVMTSHTTKKLSLLQN
ncbi:MAG TPA: hypothetical protein VK806_08135 [Bacteroidia bacterium]|jgi:hypothetical protein|nr:hypothetical protein [Bacteroidia bacterium]